MGFYVLFSSLGFPACICEGEHDSIAINVALLLLLRSQNIVLWLLAKRKIEISDVQVAEPWVATIPSLLFP